MQSTAVAHLLIMSTLLSARSRSQSGAAAEMHDLSRTALHILEIRPGESVVEQTRRRDRDTRDLVETRPGGRTQAAAP